MDRFNAMQAFARVVEAGSFTKAAQTLHMSKTTVTQLVQQLEARLRVKLLNRTTRQVKVTADGATYYERVVRLLRVTGYVACLPDFVQQPAVIDGASEFFLEALGSRGEHARTAVSAAALPRGAAVEVELIAAVREGR